MTFLARERRGGWSARGRYVAAAVLLGAALGLAILLRGPSHNSLAPLSAVVVLIVWLCGPGPALLAVVAGAVAGPALILEPRYTFAITGREVWRWGGFIVVGGLVVALGGRMRAERASALAAAHREWRARRRVELLERHAADLARAVAVEEVAAVTVDRLAGVDLEAVSVLLLRDGELHAVASTGVDAAAREAVRSGEAVEVPAGDATLLVLPLRGVDGGVVGALHLSTPPDWLDDPRRAMLHAVADQCGVALDRAAAFAAETRAREREAILRMHAAQLATCATLGDVAEATLAALEGVGATTGGIFVVDDDRRVSRLRVRGVSESELERLEGRPSVDQRTPAVEAVETGAVVAYRSADDLDTAFPDTAPARAALGIRSGIAVPLRDAEGAVVGAVSVASRDVDWPDSEGESLLLAIAEQCGLAFATARSRQREQEALAAAARLVEAARSLAHVREAVVLLDAAGSLVYWNPAAAELFALDEAARGRAFESVARGWAGIAAEARRAGTGAVTAPFDRSGVERWLRVSVVEFDGGSVYTVDDVTTERSLDQVRTGLITTVSHELRTPLSAVYGAALTLARDDLELDPQARDTLLSMVVEQSKRLATLTDEILLAGSIDLGKLSVAVRPADAARVARDALETMRAAGLAGHSLDLVAPAGLPPVAADPDRLRQVLANLLDNAVKYSPAPARVSLEIAAEGRSVSFRVRDEGIGIAAAHHERIFEPFHRVDPEQAGGVGGTGLGLYICRQLVQRMGGTIQVESRPGRGSTFTVALPVARAPALVPAERSD